MAIHCIIGWIILMILFCRIFKIIDFNYNFRGRKKVKVVLKNRNWRQGKTIQCGYCRKGFWRNEDLKTYIMKHQGYLNDNLSSVLVKFHHFYKLLKLCTVIDGTFIIHAICGEWAKWLAS